jgi:protease-4
LSKLQYYYRRFVDTVARGRELSAGQVDAVGRGHVWSGRAAQARGLVDAFGGIADAIAEARRLAGIREGEPVEIDALPEEQSLFGMLLKLLGLRERARSEANSALPSWLTDVAHTLPLSVLFEPAAVQARMEEQIQIR